MVAGELALDLFLLGLLREETCSKQDDGDALVENETIIFQNRHKAVGFTFEQWRYVFTNTFSEEEARRLYERYHIPASGRVFWGSALANIHPGPDDTHVDYNNPDRAPLLFISGSEDHLMPPSIQRSNAKHYKGEGTITEVKEFEGRAHLMPSQTGWEEIADYALDWATSQTAAAVAEPSMAVEGP